MEPFFWLQNNMELFINMIKKQNYNYNFFRVKYQY